MFTNLVTAETSVPGYSVSNRELALFLSTVATTLTGQCLEDLNVVVPDVMEHFAFV